MSEFTEAMYHAADASRGLITVGDNRSRSATWQEIHRQARCMAGALASAGVGPGTTVGVLAADPADVAPLAQAIWMRGAALTMLHQPTARTDLNKWFADIATALTMIDAETVVVGAPFDRAAARLRDGELPVIAIETLRDGSPVAPFDVGEQDIALLQLTSGSTGTPKAVEITHANLAANTTALVTAAECVPERDVVVSWLPLSHDMGMIGFLTIPMQIGAQLIATTPDRFMRRPALWPEMISTYGGTVTAGPNFSYALLARCLESAPEGAFDLSSLRVALNGAEPIDSRDIQRMTIAGSRFGLAPEAVVPAYGMAETTLCTSFDSPRQAPGVDVVAREDLETHGRAVPGTDGSTRSIVSCGRPVRSMRVRITDADGMALPARHIGRIQVRGPMVTRGYVTVDGRVPAQDADGWLDTGDLGYRDEADELYVCGRVKDVIIIGGKNLYPTDIERVVCTVDGVRAGNAVAVRIDAGEVRESFTVIAESMHADDPQRAGQLQAQIARTVRREVGYSPRQVFVVAPRTLPKTPSGKPRRRAAAELVTTLAPEGNAKP
ncbi:fatty acyl-AMP ligase [Nocardia nepalensis]|uniref:fatty acyl-AMP ligase n=1 Tax=Nocardia nepalensis TaxID=3375448 RepID=UPI003B66C712